MINYRTNSEDHLAVKVQVKINLLLSYRPIAVVFHFRMYTYIISHLEQRLVRDQGHNTEAL